MRVWPFSGFIPFLLFLLSSVNAQDSTAQRGDDEKESITCSGPLPNLDRWRQEWPEIGDEIESIAQFCSKATYPFPGALCGWQILEPVIIFDPDRYQNIATRNRYPSEATEFCYIKCRCTNKAVKVDKPGIKYYLPGSMIEATYDFDAYPIDFSLTDTSNHRVHGDFSVSSLQLTNSVLLNHNTIERTRFTIFIIDRRSLPFPPQPEVFLRKVAFVGSARNKPTCRSSTLPSTVQKLLVGAKLPQITDATKLCVHRFYGGSRTANLGGICLNPDPNSRLLTFSPNLRSPLLHPAAFGSAEAFCHSVCWCTPEEKLRKTVVSSRLNGDTTNQHVTTSPRIIVYRPLEYGGGSRETGSSSSAGGSSFIRPNSWRLSSSTNYNARCGSPCSRRRDCEGDCTCRAWRTTVQEDARPKMKAICVPKITGWEDFDELG